jgi:hypothetical protein
MGFFAFTSEDWKFVFSLLCLSFTVWIAAHPSKKVPYNSHKSSGKSADRNPVVPAESELSEGSTKFSNQLNQG